MKVLFLATYFPRPSNMKMGTWSLDLAIALQEQGVELEVVSLTPWFPSWFKKISSGVGTYCDCPHHAELSHIFVHYPRWFCYPIKQFWKVMSIAPSVFLTLGWISSKNDILKITQEFNPDVVLANHSLINGFVAKQINDLTKIPYITVDHEVGDYLVCQDNDRWKDVMSCVLEVSSGTITVSNKMKALAQMVFPSGKFQTIHNGAGFIPCELTALNRHVKKDDVVIFCCGNLYGRKDIPLLIKAFDRLCDKYPEVTLRIAGDGPDREMILKIIQKSKSVHSIFYLGSIEHKQVQQEMLSADVFALVGWAEPFGIVFLEAMANGCSVVVSEDAGVAEILNDGETALFIEPHNQDSVLNALIKLVESSSFRKNIALAGHELYSSQYQWNQVAKQYVQLLESR